jgi:hypothetical protein
MPTKENPPYKLVATFYDEILPGISEKNRHAREKVLGDKLDAARTVCDLACGNGSTAKARSASATSGLRANTLLTRNFQLFDKRTFLTA